MAGFLENIFGRRSAAERLRLVEKINSLESDIQKLSSAGLTESSRELKEEIKQGLSLDDALPRAYAFAREAAKRTLGQRPYDVQIIGGIVLHKGGVAEMATGEGKTLSAVAPAYLNALAGRGVHVVTVNEYLARRDAVWMGQIYRLLGLSVSCLVPNAAFLYDPAYTRINADSARINAENEGSLLLDQERDSTGAFRVQQEYLRPATRREAYLADVTYGTNHEFGFDYLRDNLAYSITQEVQRGHAYAIIDEVDSILVDEARTPLIISAPDMESSELYKTFAGLVRRLTQDEDYEVDEKKKSVLINDSGIEKVEKLLGVNNMYAPENLRLVHYLEESLKAKELFHLDRDYVARNGEIIIVDEFTGRLLHGRRYNGGLHQAIEAKEGVAVQQESRTYGKISIQNYFRMYERIAGMTGTAQTSAEEFHKVYNLEVVTIPTNKPNVRKDAADLVYKTADAKWRAIVADIGERHKKGQPVLVGTTSISKNEHLSALLSAAHIPHNVLNAKKNEEEGAIIAQAGKAGKVTVATNIAGRGVDIILGGNPPDADEADKVRGLGGLCVIGTERHEARRIDNQLRGRTARQGDPGFTQFFLSLEDELMRIFGGDRVKGLMERFNLPEDQPIQHGLVSRAVEQAQAKVEGANFDVRKHLLEYDDVLNRQRTAVYGRRRKILTSGNAEELGQIIFEAASARTEQINNLGSEETLENQEKDALVKRSVEAAVNPEAIPRLLGILDILWMNHLDDLEALQESIGLRAYAQHDPLVEYRHEAKRLFDALWENFNAWVFANMFQSATSDKQQATRIGSDAPAVVVAPPKEADPRFANVGRNEPCPCGSGKKFKKCHGK